jgi:hypothetical protein
VEKTDNIPMWVYLAFSSITARKGALILIWSSLAFSLYCIPWDHLFPAQQWVGRVFLIDGWSWFAMMIPVTAWYWLALRWMDRRALWVKP